MSQYYWLAQSYVNSKKLLNVKESNEYVNVWKKWDKRSRIPGIVFELKKDLTDKQYINFIIEYSGFKYHIFYTEGLAGDIQYRGYDNENEYKSDKTAMRKSWGILW